MKTFQCDSTYDYFLYASNYIAESMTSVISSNGFKLKGIVDRRFVEPNIKMGGVIQCDLNYISGIESKDKCIFVICLSNGLEQEKVARQFSELGFHKLIYLPMQISRPLDEEAILRRAYHCFITGNLQEIELIPQSYFENEPDRYRKELIIHLSEKEVIFWCPIKFLRTAKYQYFIQHLLLSKKNIIEKMEPVSDIPIENRVEYFSLFDFLSGKTKEYPYVYLSMHRESPHEQKKLLEDRRSLFKVYEERYMYDKSFFLDSPISVEWNSEGYFNVLDGLHRAIYLCTKGDTKVPVTTSSVEYRQYEDYCLRNKDD